jgi:hypothetical protein
MVLNKIPSFQEVKDWVNSNADVPNADYADSAGDANTVDGKHAYELGAPSSTNQAGASTQSFEIGYAYDGDSSVRDGIFLPAEKIEVIADGAAEPRVTLAKAGDVESGTYYQDMVMSWNLGPNYGETHKVIVHVATDYDHSHSL